MEAKHKSVEIFTAEDGKEFLSQAECLNYEKNVLSVLKNIKYFSAVFNPDLTEGRGCQNIVYLAVINYDSCASLRALKYMMDSHGSPIAYVQGKSPTKNWSIPMEIDAKKFRRTNPADRVFISPEEIEGFPKAIWVK